MRDRKPSGYWQSLDNVILEARILIEEKGFSTLPSFNQLMDLGYSSLCYAIQKYHGGFHSFRESLGETERRINGWPDIDTTVSHARDFMEEHGFVVDFSKLKAWLEQNVVEQFDHTLLNDTIAIPTAENILRYIKTEFDRTGYQISADVRLAYIRVWETDDSMIEEYYTRL